MIARGVLQEHSKAFGVIMRVLDIGAVMVSAILANVVLFDNWDLPSDYENAFIVGGLLAIIFFSIFSLYRAWRGISLVTELRAVTAAWVAVFLALFAIGVLGKSVGDFSREWLGLWFGLGWVLLIGFRVVLRVTLMGVRAYGFNPRRVVLVGSGDLSAQLGARLATAPWVGLRVLGFFDDRNTRRSVDESIPKLGSFSDLAMYLEDHTVDQVWLALPLRAEDTMRRVLHDLRHTTVDIRFVPDIFGFRLLNHSFSEVAGIPVVNLTTSPMTGTNQLIKALEDRAVALLILLLISPLMLLIAVGVKLSSPGPVLFSQLRHGWDGKPIRVYKFRSMEVHNETDGRVTQAVRDDPRITPFGAFLRRTSLDEIPQFINVLQGRMSVVGPRPHAIQHNEEYKDRVERYMLRHKVKPGITGWAQVNGYRGETDTLDKMEKRIEYDLYYIEHWSFWFDLKIILLTLLKGFLHRNAY